MSEAARLTSHWGCCRPTVVTSRAAPGRVPSRVGQLGGRGRARPGHDVDHAQPVDPVPQAGARRPGPASQARAIRSTGFTRSSRSMAWPEATTTGMRSGSVGGMRHGSGGPGAGRRVGRTRVAARGGKLPSPPGGGPVAAGRPRTRKGRRPVATRERVSTAGGRGDAAAGARPACPPGSCSGWPPPASRSRAGSTGPGSRPTTGWPGSRSAGWRPSGDAVGFWDRPEEALDRAAALGCDSFRLSVEWARVVPDVRGRRPGRARPVRGRSSTAASTGVSTPLVTLHHFTHPAWLGEDLWLRPDAPARFAAYARVVVDALAPSVRHWVTLNEINVLALDDLRARARSPRDGRPAFGDAAVALDNLLTAHVFGYDTIHAERPDAVVTTNNACLTVYEYDRMLVDLLLARSHGVERRRPRRLARRTPPAPLRAAAHARAPARRCSRRAAGPPGPLRRRRAGPGRRPAGLLDALDASPHERTLDVLGIDCYDPMAARHFRLPGHRTAGGRSPAPARELWDDVPDPGGLTRWLGVQHELAPGLPLWVVENGLCNRVRHGPVLRPARRVGPSPLPAGEPGRGGGGRRRRRAGRGLLALVAGRQLRVGLLRAAVRAPRGRPDRGPRAARWLETDAMGRDAAGAYRRLIAGLRSGRPVGARPRLTVRPGQADGRPGLSARRTGPCRRSPARPRPRCGAPVRRRLERVDGPDPLPVG